jgi:hypothetical protein
MKIHRVCIRNNVFLSQKKLIFARNIYDAIKILFFLKFKNIFLVKIIFLCF